MGQAMLTVLNSTVKGFDMLAVMYCIWMYMVRIGFSLPLHLHSLQCN